MSDGSTVIRRGSGQTVIGLDVSDRSTAVATVDAAGRLMREPSVATTADAMRERFEGRAPALVVLEVGTHSPWLSRLLSACGHMPLVANPNRLPYLTRHRKRTDRVDAATLARLGAQAPELLHAVAHRSEPHQVDLELVRARNAAVEARSALINHARGTVKALGERLPSCSAPAFARRVDAHLPASLRPALEPLLATIAMLSEQIRGYDRQIEQLIESRYPEARVLMQPRGVGPLTALCYVLTLDRSERFRRSRDVGPYLGLVPAERQSGNRAPELAITKAGDRMLRRLLVQCAQYMLGPFGEDCDLRRWGLALAGEGSRARKRKAVVAVARRLAVLLHHLWASGELYEPLHQERLAARAA